MEPLDRRPFGFKHKGVIYCQLCRGESVKVGRDGVLGGCIHGDMPENTPLFDVLCLGQDHLMDFSGTALEQPVDNRSRTSHAKFHLERRCICLQQKAVKGSLHSHDRGGCIVLLQCFIIWQLHVVEAHQSTQKVCIHLAHGDQSEMRIHCHRFQRRHWATIVQAAKRQTQLAARWGHQHDSWLKPQAGTNVATLQFQGLLEVVLLEGETANPLSIPEHVSESCAQLFGIAGTRLSISKYIQTRTSTNMNLNHFHAHTPEERLEK